MGLQKKDRRKLSTMGDFYIALIAANFEKIVAKDLRKNQSFRRYFYIAVIVATFEKIAGKGL